MKADYETYSTVYLIWPKSCDTWRNNAKNIKNTFCKLIKIISRYKKVVLIVDSSSKNIPKNVDTLYINYNDCWARDILPIECNNKFIIFKYNGYNGLTNNINFDKDLAQTFCKLNNLPYMHCNLVLEGGALISSGENGWGGVIVLIEECLLNRNKLDKQKIEENLKILNCNNFLWLEKGLYQDETLGHADEIIAFKNSKEILLYWTDDKTNENYFNCRKALSTIKSFYQQRNVDIKIHKIITPKIRLRKKKPNYNAF